MAVQDHAPPGGEVQLANAVVFRALPQVFSLHQLQEPEAQEEEAEEAQDYQGRAGEGPARLFLLLRGYQAAESAFQEPVSEKALGLRA